MTLVYLALAWVCGILLSHWLWSAGLLGCTTPGWPFAVLAGPAALALILFRRAGWARLATGLILMLLLGAWRYHAHPFAPCPTPADLAYYHRAGSALQATAEGVVVGYPEARDTQTFYRLRVDRLTIGGRSQAVAGLLLVQAPRFPEYAYGDRLRVSGQLEEPPTLDDFDYRAYLAREGIHSLMRRPRLELVAHGQGSWFWATLYGLRSRSSALLNRVLPEPAASLANGMLLGIESGIPDEVDEAFKATGTSHVIVISGSNVALLAGVLLAVWTRVLGRRRAALTTMAGIALYVLLVGADASALRAGLMGGLLVFGIAIGRQSTSYVSLCAAALLMTALNPLALWDVGFQLSFMATLGLILFTPALQARGQAWLERRMPHERARQIMGAASDTVIVTLAVQITALPLIVYHFGQLSLVSVPANFLILPAQPPIMIGGMATLIGGALWEPIGRIVAVVPWLFLSYTTAVVRLFAQLPFGSVETGSAGRVLAGGYYAALIVALLWRQMRWRGWIHLSARRALAAAALVVAPIWLAVNAVNTLPDGRLHLFLIPAEDGEAALLVTPGGQHVWLWDGRGDGAALASATRLFLRGWRKDVDAAIGPGAGDVWPGAQIIDPARLAPGAAVQLERDIVLVRLDGGEQWAMALHYGSFASVLPTTLKPAGQAELIRTTGSDALHTTLLKAAGPGTGAWPTIPFIEAIAPQIVLWPQDTTYPPDVAELLTGRGAVRVPPDAVVEAISDGQRLWLRQYSGQVRR